MTPRVCCCGEMMWDVRVAKGSTLESAVAMTRVAGGAAANVARALSSLGVPCAVSGTLSMDAFGRGFVQAMEHHGVDTSAIALRRGRMGVVFMEGSRFLSYRPELERWRLALPRSWRRAIPKGAILHLAALSADTPEIPKMWALSERAQRRGVLVFVDVNARPRAWRGRKPPAAARRLLASADVVKASHGDLVELGLAPSIEAHAALGMRGTLVLTNGHETTVAVGPWGKVSRRPPRAKKPARTIGAGDAFCASLLASLLAALPDAAHDDARFWRRAIGDANAYASASLAR